MLKFLKKDKIERIHTLNDCYRKSFFFKKIRIFGIIFYSACHKKAKFGKHKSKYVAEDQCSLNVNRKLCRCKANKKRKQIQSVISFFWMYSSTLSQNALYLGVLPLFCRKSQMTPSLKLTYWSNRWNIEESCEPFAA